MEKFFNELKLGLEGEVDIRTYSPLALAYMGDCVFDMLVRTYVLKKANTSANKLHNSVKRYVNATTQSKMYSYIINLLLEDEVAILKRGRNANINNVAKNATLGEYKNATGLETLFGYLYLTGNFKRVFQIFDMCLNVLEV